VIGKVGLVAALDISRRNGHLVFVRTHCSKGRAGLRVPRFIRSSSRREPAWIRIGFQRRRYIPALGGQGGYDHFDDPDPRLMVSEMGNR